MQTLSVQQVTNYIRDLFDMDELLTDVWVQGEVSNLTKASSGHWYFSVKDSKAQLRCVMFKSAAQYVRMNVKEGDEILVHGRISVYDARGEYQLYADQIEAIGGVGDLYRQFEELKAKLLAEGLFDEERKLSLPAFPRQIGIVTSPTTAAFQDMLNVLRRRFPLVQIILSPTLVQGKEAPAQIVRAIHRLNQHTQVDLIIVARGGGSIEDLWCFNDEVVARAISASRIPIISGVGHEIDFTIADFVADLRAPTPSAAAELATPNRDDLRMDIDRRTEDLRRLVLESIRSNRLAWHIFDQHLSRATPQKRIDTASAQLEQFNQRLKRAQSYYLERLEERLMAKNAALNAASPDAILARGYAIVTDKDGKVIKSEADVQTDDQLTIRVHQGMIKARVE